jgi:aminoglycoside phosphotransferase (APT) family kinase protein
MSNSNTSTELQLNLSFVKNLISTQFPQWADLPIKRFNSSGTDNAIYRIGESMAVRLPSEESGSLQIKKENRWLPIIEKHLPVAVPTPLELGTPTEDYPWYWTVNKWIKGENAITGKIDDSYQLGLDLGQCITALQQIDPSDGPLPGRHNFRRGEPLAKRDDEVRKAIEKLHGDIDTNIATKAWEAALKAPLWGKSPVWIHGDLHAGNLLVDQGRLCAIIDFGGLGVGDPACDWLFAWNLLSVKTREKLREALSVDDATWARGRGWALYVGLTALPDHRISNPVFAGIARRLIEEVLEDHS